MMEIKPSTRKGKKYMASVGGKWIHFGATGYEQYFDSTGLGVFTDDNHLDEDRRKRWYQRHGPSIKAALKKRTVTPVILSAYFLW